MPRSYVRKKLRYEKETCPLDSVRLLLIEVSQASEISKNGEFKEEFREADMPPNSVNTLQPLAEMGISQLGFIVPYGNGQGFLGSD